MVERIFRAVSIMASRPRALALYRQILRTLELWPSIRKAKIAEEIRLEFRQNALEAEASKRDKMLAEAEAGLKALRQQCGLNTEGNFGRACAHMECRER